MNRKKYQWILYAIATTILVTIGIQLYWNYKNYEENKRQIVNEIQLSLDNAIEEYYAGLAKANFITIINTKEGTNTIDAVDNIVFDSIFSTTLNGILKNTNPSKKNKEAVFTQISIEAAEDSLHFSTEQKRSPSLEKNKDSLKVYKMATKYTLSKNGDKAFATIENGLKRQGTSLKYIRGKKASDSLKLISSLSPIFISLKTDIINYNRIDSLLKQQLLQKKIAIDPVLNHYKSDTLFYSTKNKKNTEQFVFVNSKSTYFTENERLELGFSSTTLEALKRSFTGILLSLFLAMAVISSLFYLLHIINKQKELAEIKNDLISNITHEFKTPITTVSTALEAIDSFNVINDKEKTKRYLSISSVQLKKLQLMVEKLLETATLDSENLLLKREPIDIVNLVEKLTKKYQLIEEKKEIKCTATIQNFLCNVDVFHFENAISNLLDNAIKYGGSKIEVILSIVLDTLEIVVADNGLGIDKNQREKIFDKFYRIPKGNTHDVKGFGIGLYYTKKIIEKHEGTIDLVPNSKNTIFKITLPNA